MYYYKCLLVSDEDTPHDNQHDANGSEGNPNNNPLDKLLPKTNTFLGMLGITELKEAFSQLPQNITLHHRITTTFLSSMCT